MLSFLVATVLNYAKQIFERNVRRLMMGHFFDVINDRQNKKKRILLKCESVAMWRIRRRALKTWRLTVRFSTVKNKDKFISRSIGDENGIRWMNLNWKHRWDNLHGHCSHLNDYLVNWVGLMEQVLLTRYFFFCSAVISSLFSIKI